MSGKLEKLLALHRENGLSGVAKTIGHSVMSSICDYQIQEVRGRVRTDQDSVLPPPKNESDLATECLILEPGDSLGPFAAEFPLPFRDSFDSLQQRLEQGCTLILARRAQQGGTGQEIVGYTIMELGGFSAAGIKRKISKDILFVHYTEVAQKYRGQRIALVLTRAINEYCRKRGIIKSCTAHSTGNIPSERAFRNFGSRILCYAVRVSVLRGLFVWHTPWKKIEKAIGELDSVGRSREQTARPQTSSQPAQATLNKG